jgi:hypothetical protein
MCACTSRGLTASTGELSAMTMLASPAMKAI